MMINNTPEKQIIKTQVGDVEILLPQLTNIPVAIRQQPTALWRAEPELDNGGNQKLKPNGKPRISKAPRNASGYNISKLKPEQWSTFGDCSKAFKPSQFSGTGILLQASSGIVGIDLDDVTELFQKRPELKSILKDAISKKVYCETSPSGKGLRMFVCGSLSDNKGKRQGGIELYSDKSFLTVTGLQTWPGDVIDAQWLVDALLTMICASGTAPNSLPAVSPSAIPQVSKVNAQLVAKLAAWAANEHPRLWGGRWDEPPQLVLEKKYDSQSEADMALAGHIAREAVNEGAAPNTLEATVMAVFEQSAQYRPDKRRTMVNHTIPKVVESALENSGLFKPLIDEVNERFGLIEGVGIYDKSRGCFVSDQQFRQLYSNRHVELSGGAA
jgi:primase-polymerase (primpol)-like protein